MLDCIGLMSQYVYLECGSDMASVVNMILNLVFWTEVGSGVVSSLRESFCHILRRCQGPWGSLPLQPPTLLQGHHFRSLLVACTLSVYAISSIVITWDNTQKVTPGDTTIVSDVCSQPICKQLKPRRQESALAEGTRLVDGT